MLETCTTKEAVKSHAYLRDFGKEVKNKDMELRRFRQEKERQALVVTSGSIFEKLSC